MIYVLDIDCNVIRKFANEFEVTDICLDRLAETLAVSFADCQIQLLQVYSGESSTMRTVNQVSRIAIDPHFSSAKSKKLAYATATGKLFLFEKSWRKEKDKLIAQNQSNIKSVKLADQMVAWSNDKGITIVNADYQKIGTIVPPHAFGKSSFTDFLWNDSELIAVFGNVLKIGRMNSRRRFENATSIFEVIRELHLDFQPSDFVFDQKMFIFAEKKDRTFIKFVDLEGRLQAVDRSPFDEFGRLSVEPAMNQIFISSKTQIFSTRSRTNEDHLSWLIKSQKLSKAYAVMQKNHTAERRSSFNADEIGEQYLDKLFRDQNFEKAAIITAEICSQNPSLWSKWISRFQLCEKISAISHWIPLNPPLFPELYDLILTGLLEEDVRTLLEMLQKYPIALYNVDRIISAIYANLNESFDELVESCFIFLLNETRQFDRLSKYCLDNGKPEMLLLSNQHVVSSETIKLLADNLIIPSLQSALTLMLKDRKRQVEILCHLKKLLEQRVLQLTEQLEQRAKRSMTFSAAGSRCCVCNQTLLQGRAQSLVYFNCKHVIHSDCHSDLDLCPICNA